MSKNIRQQFALIQELENSVKLIELGLGEYQNLNQNNDFYYLPFQLLSSGLERLMKCHICLGYLEQYEKYPNFNYIKNLGHDLNSLKKEIIKNYYSINGRSALREYLEFINYDEDLNEIITLLSEFGKFARYHNLDVITGKENPSIDVKNEWEQLESKILHRYPNILEKNFSFEFSEEASQALKSIIIAKIERFVRAITSQFTMGNLGKEAQSLYSLVSSFIKIKDKDLGTKDYRKKTTAYSRNQRKAHKRTFFDKIVSWSNINYKRKKVKKIDFGDNWPFYSDEVVVECREKMWCVVTIKGYDYALNGSAAGRYKLPFVHDAGMAILGKSVSSFIDLTRKLGE